MVFAKQLGLSSDGVINFAPVLFMVPTSVAPCLSPSRSLLSTVGSDATTCARVDSSVSEGASAGRPLALRVFWRCFLEGSVGAGGLLSASLFFFLIGLGRPYRF